MKTRIAPAATPTLILTTTPRNALFHLLFFRFLTARQSYARERRILLALQ